MPATVVDYSRNKQAGGKFVVLVSAVRPDDGLVLFSDFSLDSQHADIVRRWERTHSTSVHAGGWRVRGGGWWRMAADGVLELYGRSAAYGPFDPDWIAANLRLAGAFNAHAIRMA